jgi:hypothetical protein
MMTIRTALLLSAAVIATGLLTGCQASVAPTETASTGPTAASEKDGTGAAETRLQTFFDAWAAKDVPALESSLPAGHRGGTWGFEDIDRVEFGPVTESPEDVDTYMNGGAGGASGVERSDVRAFRASITFFYKPGSSGPAEDARPMDYTWFLERLPSGEWQVSDWGY